MDFQVFGQNINFFCARARWTQGQKLLEIALVLQRKNGLILGLKAPSANVFSQIALHRLYSSNIFLAARVVIPHMPFHRAGLSRSWGDPLSRPCAMMLLQPRFQPKAMTSPDPLGRDGGLHLWAPP